MKFALVLSILLAAGAASAETAPESTAPADPRPNILVFGNDFGDEVILVASDGQIDVREIFDGRIATGYILDATFADLRELAEQTAGNEADPSLTYRLADGGRAQNVFFDSEDGQLVIQMIGAAPVFETLGDTRNVGVD